MCGKHKLFITLFLSYFSQIFHDCGNPGDYPNIWVNIYACSQCRHATISDRFRTSCATLVSFIPIQICSMIYIGTRSVLTVYHCATRFRWDTRNSQSSCNCIDKQHVQQKSDRLTLDVCEKRNSPLLFPLLPSVK